ncbi:MAG: AIR synthase-related protein, partial [Acidimicrobiales bacterium]
VAHITGGGIAGNLARVLRDDVDAVVRRRTWEMPRIFEEIRHSGEVSDEEMERVFNLGIGMIVAVPANDAFKAMDLLREKGHRAVRVGEVVGGRGAVHLER